MKPQLLKCTFILIALISLIFPLLNAQHSEFYGFSSNDIFRIDSAGNNLQLLYTFPSSFKGVNPSSSLCKANDGKFYGITQGGGVHQDGVLFEWDPVTNIYKEKLDLDSTENGSGQFSSLFQADNGKLYGMTSMGGTNNLGVLFEYDPVTNILIKKLDFNGVDNGSSPMGSLIQADNGKIYGMTYQGGVNDLGVLFEWDPAIDTYTKKLDFNGSENGSNPAGSLLQAGNGLLYGMTWAGGANSYGVLFEWAPNTNIYIKKFDFDLENGGHPSSLIKASNGRFYGVASGGIYGFGVLFEWDNETNNYIKKLDFNSVNNGLGPESLVQAENGKIYGITDHPYWDVLFEWDPQSETFTKKIAFSGEEKGNRPFGSLVSGGNGKLYGMTREGGTMDCGIIYEWDPENDAFTKMFDFKKADNGLNPTGVPVQADNGKLYGMTRLGGDLNDGVLFEWDPATYTFTRKFSFTGKVSGKEPFGSLLKASNGKLYGITNSGGTHDCGVLFEWDPSNNTFTKKLDLLKINSSLNSFGSLMQAENGKLYGTLSEGGSLGRGVLFEWDPVKDVYRGKFDFNGVENGSNPYGPLVQADNGKLYGTTNSGGSNSLGVLFEYDPVTNIFIKKLDFTGTDNGSRPYGSLLRADNGKLYGTTSEGGLNNYGVLFEWDPVNDTYTKEIDFSEVENGVYPRGSLMQASNGKIYGRIYPTQWSDLGSLFEWDPVTHIFIKGSDSIFKEVPLQDGFIEIKYPASKTVIAEACNTYISPSGKYVWNESGEYKDTIPGALGYKTILTVNLTINHSTESTISPRAYHRYMSPGGKIWKNTGEYKDTIPNAAGCDSILTINLTIVHSDSSSAQEFYGMTFAGGEYDKGTIYKTDAQGNNLMVVYSFNSDTNGYNPMGTLVQVDNEKLYGTTFYGGKYGLGVLFEWDISTHTFSKTGSHPKGSMVLADNGKLIGLTDYTRDGSPVIFEWDPMTGFLSKKFTFPGGAYPVTPTGSLVKAKNGKIYGMSVGGSPIVGEIFEWDPYTSAYIRKFEGNHYSMFSLTQADNGKFYGLGGGGIFEWEPNTNTLNIKCNFIPGNKSFTYLCSSLMQSDNGKFYGRTGDAEYILGNIYEWDTTFNIAIDKIGNSDLRVRRFFDSPLLLAGNGKIYGTSSDGSKYGIGALFEYDPVTNIFETKNYFDTTNGSVPSGGLIELKHCSSGLLYAESFCSFTSPSGKYTWTSTGIHRDTIPNGSGGDSIINVHLTVKNSITNTISEVACDSYTSPGGKVWTVSGEYRDTIPSAAGCDSIIIINLAIHSADTTVTQNKSVLTANAADAAYQWINCDNGNSPLEGETHQIYTAASDGNYAVIVSQNGCIDTSACYAVSATGLVDHTFKHNVTLYPNPTDGSFTIDLGRIYPKAEITLTQPDGRVIREESIINGRYKELQISESPGPYIVTIKADHQNAVFKIVKK
jgi:uncharacterized repeat protein (TIGR03803 family)